MKEKRSYRKINALQNNIDCAWFYLLLQINVRNKDSFEQMLGYLLFTML